MIAPEFVALPDLAVGEYLPEMMFKVGPLRAIGEGMAATDWPVLMAFAANQMLDAEDTESLFEMCRAYCSALRDGESPFAIAPLDQEPGELVG